MTKNQWLDKAELRQNILRRFIIEWHPAMDLGDRLNFPITATMPEKACHGIRENIKNEYLTVNDLILKDRIITPIDKFDKAIENRDFDTIYNLLNDA